MPVIRGLLFYFIIYSVVILHGIFGVLFARLLPFNLRFKILVTWNFITLFCLRHICGIKTEILGREHIAQDSPVVVMSNHESAWETIALQTIFGPLSTVLKRELLRIPFFGWALAAVKPIAIDRGNPRDAMRAVLNKGLHRISEGLNVLIFPEGTRTAAKKSGKYARSGAAIAVDARVPVIPIAHNASTCWPNGKLAKYPGTITLSIGPAINTAGKTSKAVTAETQAWIEAECQRIAK